MLARLICKIRGHVEPDLIVSDTELLWRCPQCKAVIEPPEHILEQQLLLNIQEARKEIDDRISEVIHLQNLSPEDAHAVREGHEKLIMLTAKQLAWERYPYEKPGITKTLKCVFDALRIQGKIISHLEKYASENEK